MKLNLVIISLGIIYTSTFSQNFTSEFKWDGQRGTPCFPRIANKYISDKQMTSVRNYFNTDLKEGKRQKKDAILFANALITYYGLCEYGEIEPRFLNDYQISLFEQNVISEYCGCLYSQQKLKRSVIIERYSFLKREYFCAYSRAVAFLPSSYFSNDEESGDRLEQLAFNLCEDLRSNNISLYDAYYRFDFEAELTYAKLDLERGRNASELLKELKDIFIW